MMRGEDIHLFFVINLNTRVGWVGMLFRPGEVFGSNLLGDM